MLGSVSRALLHGAPLLRYSLRLLDLDPGSSAALLTPTSLHSCTRARITLDVPASLRSMCVCVCVCVCMCTQPYPVLGTHLPESEKTCPELGIRVVHVCAEQRHPTGKRNKEQPVQRHAIFGFRRRQSGVRECARGQTLMFDVASCCNRIASVRWRRTPDVVLEESHIQGTHHTVHPQSACTCRRTPECTRTVCTCRPILECT